MLKSLYDVIVMILRGLKVVERKETRKINTERNKDGKNKEGSK
jgi:hypothetical protein